MRDLVLTRGIPGSGKSTFLENANLDGYVLSSDSIRLLFGGLDLGADGTLAINHRNENPTWQLLYTLLEERMKNGEFTVIDATNTKGSDLSQALRLAEKWDYRVSLLDFADVPLQTCLDNNAKRLDYKKVPEDKIKTMYERMQNMQLDKKIQVVKPEQWNEFLEFPVLDLSSYKRIHHIGDIQGCVLPLQEYFKNGVKKDEFYILVGDLFDRGPDNAEVFRFVQKHLLGKKNVVMVEGNHEIHVRAWARGDKAFAKQFNDVTLVEFLEAGITREEAIKLMRGFQEALVYAYKGKKVMVTHAGFSAVPEQMRLISGHQLTHGSGGYNDTLEMAASFEQNTEENTFQVHGHRNTQELPIKYTPRCFNLEGKIEFGGSLRIVQLDDSGWNGVEIANIDQRLNQPRRKVKREQVNQVLETVKALRENTLIKEKELGDISSFNFTRQAFYDAKWDEQTIIARGLFINTKTGDVVIRGFDKFFNISEREETQLPALKESLQFPVKAYLKENGYLGMLGYDDASDSLVFASKSTTDSDFSEWFKKEFKTNFTDKEEQIKRYLRAEDACMLFEVILPEEDPHIVNYKEKQLVLLDVVKRQLEFERIPDAERNQVAKRFGFKAKEQVATLKDASMLEGWLNAKSKPANNPDDFVEGYVLEDAAGYQVKTKLPDYNLWKVMRSHLLALQAGREPKIREHVNEEAQRAFIDFVKSEGVEDGSIVEWRGRFLQSLNGKAKDKELC